MRKYALIWLLHKIVAFFSVIAIFYIILLIFSTANDTILHQTKIYNYYLVLLSIIMILLHVAFESSMATDDYIKYGLLSYIIRIAIWLFVVLIAIYCSILLPY